MNTKIRHWILMGVFCLIPIIAMALLWNAGGTKTALFNSGWGWLVIALCPLSHILMMIFGLHGHDHSDPQPVAVGQESAPPTEDHHHHH